MRGNPKGEAVEAVATILDKSANGATYDAIGKRYGLIGKTFNLLLEVARRDEEQRFDRTESGELNTMAPTFKDVYDEKYLLLTTFTKDGKPKPTTVWGVPEGDKLLIITDDGSWKTKRINNTPRVTIQKAGALGKVKGEPVEADGAHAARSPRPGGFSKRSPSATGGTRGGWFRRRSSAAASTRCTLRSRSQRRAAGFGRTSQRGSCLAA